MIILGCFGGTTIFGNTHIKKIHVLGPSFSHPHFGRYFLGLNVAFWGLGPMVVSCSFFFCHRTNLLHVHSSCIWGMTLFKVVIFWREKTPWGKCPEGDTYLSCLLLQQVEKPQKSWAFPKFNRWESQKRFRQRGGVFHSPYESPNYPSKTYPCQK